MKTSAQAYASLSHEIAQLVDQIKAMGAKEITISRPTRD
jgi:hypothetical protein